jgi:nicotinate-nucleotide adenylyltransferase
MSRAARIFRADRLIGRASVLLGQVEAPKWAFANLPMSQLSSTAIRETGKWRAGAVDDHPLGE